MGIVPTVLVSQSVGLSSWASMVSSRQAATAKTMSLEDRVIAALWKPFDAFPAAWISGVACLHFGSGIFADNFFRKSGGNSTLYCLACFTLTQASE